MKRTPIKRVSSGRASQLAEYRRIRAQFMRAHPLCQATLLEHGIPEKLAIEKWCGDGARQGYGVIILWNGFIVRIPAAVEIHHRNKKNGIRLTDERWFLAVSGEKHDWIESHLSEARALGWSLDISANPDGMTPGGTQALTTTELFARLES